MRNNRLGLFLILSLLFGGRRRRRGFGLFTFILILIFIYLYTTGQI